MPDAVAGRLHRPARLLVRPVGGPDSGNLRGAGQCGSPVSGRRGHPRPPRRPGGGGRQLTGRLGRHAGGHESRGVRRDPSGVAPGAREIWCAVNDLLLTYYGDDFTGSTDALEALTLGGVPAVLFLEPPTRDVLTTQFPGVR